MRRIALLSLGPLVAIAACDRSAPSSAPANDTPDNSIAALSDADAIVARLRSTFVTPTASGATVIRLEPGDAKGFTSSSEGFAPRFAPENRPAYLVASQPAEVMLPRRADRPFFVRHGGLSLSVRSLVARSVEPLVGNEALVYPGAVLGGSLLHVPTRDGTEEYVHLASAPTSPELRYELGVSGGRVGLRLVNKILEVVAEDGNPVFHTTAPWIVDARGQMRQGSIAVEGCAIDRDERLPWGRPITPMAGACTVVARWDDAGLRYPLLVDPGWTTANHLAQARENHLALEVSSASGPCQTGCVVVSGGDTNPTPLNTVEVYNEAAGTWAAGAAMPGNATNTTGARATHVGGAWPYNGKVIVGGGWYGASYTPLAQVDMYDVGTGAWTALPDLPKGARKGLAATWGMFNAGQEIFFTGGSTASAVVNSVDMLAIGFGTPSWEASPAQLGTARSGHAIASWSTGGIAGPSVVVAGGRNAGGVVTSVEVFSGNSGPAWISGGSINPGRSNLVAVSDGSSHIVFAGGTLANGNGSGAIDVFNVSGISTSSSAATIGQRTDFAGALAQATYGYRAVFVGGHTGVTSFDYDQSSAYFVDFSGGVTGSNSFGSARRYLQATTLRNGSVLVTGGFYISCVPGSCSTQLYNEVDLYTPVAKGGACSSNADCDTWQCVDGVCCDKACTGQCEACNLTGSVGTCTTVTPTNGPSGYNQPGQSVTGFGTTTRPGCALYGTTCGATCDGTSATQCNNAPNTTQCTSQSCAMVGGAGTQTNAAYCNGTGGCNVATTTPCGVYACNGGGADAGASTACNSTCTGNADCAAGYKCAGGNCVTTGAAGTSCAIPTDCNAGLSCVDSTCCTTSSCPSGQVCNANGKGTCSKPIAGACSGDAECGSGHCVDGVCCDKPCTAQCEACDATGSVGTCSAISGAPHGTRTACSDGAGNVCAALTCDGLSTTQCAGFANGPNKQCTPASCTNGAATTAAFCDGKGTCKPGVTTACGTFACDTDACKTKCTGDQDCAQGLVCDTTGGTCVAPKSTCSADGLSSNPADRSPPKSCGAFKCNVSTGDCYTHCTTVNDCSGDNVCGPDGTCAPPAAAAAPTDSGCSVSRRDAPASSGMGGLGVLVAGAAFLARRKRRS